MPPCAALSLYVLLLGQESEGSPGSMCWPALGGSVPMAGAQWGTHPSVGPCLQGLTSNNARPKPEWSQCLPLLPKWGKISRSQKVKCSRGQETKRLEEPATACLMFTSPLPELRVPWKPVGMSSSPSNEGWCWPCLPFPLFWLPCSIRGQSLQSHTFYTSSLLLSHKLPGCLGTLPPLVAPLSPWRTSHF